MANDMYVEESLHSLLVHLKERHRHILKVMLTIASENGSVAPEGGRTAIQRIKEASGTSASNVSDAIGDLEYAKLIIRHPYRDDSGKNEYLFEILAADLYTNWAIRQLVEVDKLWSGRERETVRSKEWLDALRNLGALV